MFRDDYTVIYTLIVAMAAKTGGNRAPTGQEHMIAGFFGGLLPTGLATLCLCFEIFVLRISVSLPV